ncbi:hypothetical protein AN216_21705 [Streptomyces oceani]|uniref:Uncharacterized protein n=1 Tax=Streptomyces oceani TaxID=1075402 RepID=A0A1E7JWX7_9ACTN|nr:hypothetical protein AN216_21705 [Streptomyces oceani]
MMLHVVREPEALSQAERHAQTDPPGCGRFSPLSIYSSASPKGAFGSVDLLRIHVGAYRVLHEITGSRRQIGVIHLGRLS